MIKKRKLKILLVVIPRHSLSLVVTRYHLLPPVALLIVTHCTIFVIRCYLFSFVVTLCHSMYVQKTIFSFSKCSEKIVFPKKLHRNMILLILTGKMMFLFPENMISFFRQKMKGDLSLKNTWKYDVFFKFSEKMFFSKKSRRNMIFLVSSGKMAFLFAKNLMFLL